MLQLTELDDIRLALYESSNIYKERIKRWHDKHIMKKLFGEGDIALLFNSKLRLSPGKMRSQWSGPFKVNKGFPY